LGLVIAYVSLITVQIESRGFVHVSWRRLLPMLEVVWRPCEVDSAEKEQGGLCRDKGSPLEIW